MSDLVPEALVQDGQPQPVVVSRVHEGLSVVDEVVQRLPAADRELAEKARHKNLLGYHDIRLGNEPDERLISFVHQNLPRILPDAHERYEEFKDLLWAYATDEMGYEEFAARVRRRDQGTDEDSDWAFHEPI